jgi:hypothetical protein
MIVRFGLIMTVLCVSCANAHSQILFSDNFESYANHSAFASTWNAQGSPPHVLDTTFGQSSSQSVMLVPQATGAGTTNRWYRDVGTLVQPTDANPIRFSFDFYLDPAGAGTTWASDWQLADVRAFSGGAFGSGSLNGIVALSVARNSTLSFDSYNGAYFQGRIFTSGHTAQTYHTLDALPTAIPRSSGWHNLAAQIGATQTLFIIDGQPAELVPFGITTPFSSVILGSDVSSVHPFWVDNVRLEQIPEPAGLSLISAVLLAALVRRRRRTKQLDAIKTLIT